MRFEEKLMDLRKKKGISQEKLADILNVTRQTVSKWELGQTKPDMDKLIELSKYYGLSVEDLTNDQIDLDAPKENITIDNDVNGTSYNMNESSSNKDNNSYANVKGRTKERKERKWLVYVLAIVLIVSAIGLAIGKNYERKQKQNNMFGSIFSIFSTITDSITDSINDSELESNVKDNISKIQSTIGVSSFNFDYSKYTNNSLIDAEEMRTLISKVITTNNNYASHQISIEYNGQIISGNDSLQNLKNSIEDKKGYNVTLDYDVNGYINIIKVKVIKTNMSVRNFNFGIVGIDGISVGFFKKSYLDEILIRNRNNPDMLITVSYNDITTTNEDEIKEIRKKLEDHTEYDAIVEYDSDGYVNKVTLKDY